MKCKKRVNEYSFSAKGVWTRLLILLFLSLLIALFSVLNAASLKLLLDIASGENSIPILTGSLLALFVIAFKAFLDSFKSVYSEKIQNLIARAAKSDLLKHIERLPFYKLQSYHSGDLLTRLSDDTDLCAKVLPKIGSEIFVGAASCIAALFYGFMLNWKLTVLCILLSPLAVLWSKIILPFLQKYAALVREKESEIRSFSQEELSYIPVIKSFSSYHQSRERFVQKFDELARTRILCSLANAVLNGGATVVGFFSFIGAASLGAYLSIQGEITVGTIVGFIQLLNYIVWPFTELMPLIGEFQNGKAARARIRELEEITPEEEEEENDFNGSNVELEIRDLSFQYDSDLIFDNVNIDLKGNQFVGIMGPSGCGKSTFVQLLMALYEPSEGTICLTDGECRIQGISMRKQISYVPQDHLLITGTIAENIAYGKEIFVMEDVITASKKAGIHDFICSLAEGYQTIVQEKGTNFSFGQAQRIAIARAIYRNTPVLILDEPTASLDHVSSQMIIETLQKESKNRLCIMVCHDQTENSQVFDRIIKFNNKKIIDLEIKHM